VAYPKLIGKLLQVDLSTQMKAILRPTLVTGLLFLSVTTFESYLPTRGWHSLGGWLAFVLSAGFTACFALIIAFTCGLSRKQQKTILNRVRVLVKTSKE
jgi:hypothetical protein